MAGLCYFFLRQTPGLPLPPGPKPLPLIGNLHQLPKKDQWQRHQEWHEKYGPIITVRMGMSTMIMISDYAIANELLERRAAIYSSRPKMLFLNKYLTNSLQPIMQPFGPGWKRLHRLHMMLLNPTTTRAYHHLQDLESRQFMKELLSTPSDSHTSRFTRYTLSFMMGLVFGERAPRGDETEPNLMRDCLMRRLTGFHWTYFLADLLPPLDWLPKYIAPWARAGKRMRDYEMGIYERNIEAALARPHWSWAKELSHRGKGEKLSSEQICYVISELFMAGTSGTIVGWNIFVAVALLNPDCIQRVQQELDAVVGLRMPTVQDISQLPYLTAFLHELLRFRPILPTGFPHAATQDDEYNGFRVPRAAQIVTNTWLMDSDESLYPDATSFRPERWLENPGLPMTAFGFGRRKCPGRDVARSSLLLALGRCLWGFRIEFDHDDPASLEQSSIVTARGKSLFEEPESVKARFLVRSPKHEAVITHDWENANTDLGAILKATRDEIPILQSKGVAGGLSA